MGIPKDPPYSPFDIARRKEGKVLILPNRFAQQRKGN